MRIWSQLQQKGINTSGLMKLLGFSEDDESRDNTEEDPLEGPEEAPDQYSEEPPFRPVEGELMD